MAGERPEKPRRLQIWWEKRRLKREQAGDTPQAQVERRKLANQYDENVLKRIGEGIGPGS